MFFKKYMESKIKILLEDFLHSYIQPSRHHQYGPKKMIHSQKSINDI